MNTAKYKIAAVGALLSCLFPGYCLSAEPPARAARPPEPPGSYQPAAPRPIDPSTLHGKLIFGYEGWFATADDDGPLDNWNHWSRDRKRPNADNVRVQMWPDLSEYDADELYETGLKYPDGSVAKVYSAWNLKTVMRHFRWMRDYNLDGAMQYRFISRISTDPAYRAFYNQVLANNRARWSRPTPCSARRWWTRG